MIVITGGRGVVGTPLCEQLDSSELAYLSISRNPQPRSRSLVSDLNMPMTANVLEKLSSANILIHCAPIWLLPRHLPSLGNTQIKRLIVFSSTSVLSKRQSSDASEQSLVTQLADAERDITAFCAEKNWALTIFRPSMIYGYGLDQNVMHIARFLKRFGFMLLVGKANGGRQPVHSSDLVLACLSALENPKTHNQTYNLAGGEVITYREMVSRIAKGLGRKPRLLSMPLWLFRAGLSLASKLGRFAYTPDMANRMNQDLVYDIQDAKRDFNYRPEPFLQHPARDLRFEP